MSERDPITSASQNPLGGDPGLDEPRVFSTEPTPPLLQFDGSSIFMTGDPEAKTPPPKITYEPQARVFIVNEDGCPEYNELLKRGANGDIILGRKEVADMKGTAAYKVYQEWMLAVKPRVAS